VTRDRFLARLRSELPECDRAILDRPDVTAVSTENVSVTLSTIEWRERWCSCAIHGSLSSLMSGARLSFGTAIETAMCRSRMVAASRAHSPTVTQPILPMRVTISSLVEDQPDRTRFIRVQRCLGAVRQPPGVNRAGLLSLYSRRMQCTAALLRPDHKPVVLSRLFLILWRR